MDSIVARPFIKWVGGKTQLLPELTKVIESMYDFAPIDKYVEPFIGGGALFFWLCSHKQIKSAVISDINEDLILAYKTVQHHHHELIKSLQVLETQYFASESEALRELMFYEIRKLYNQEKIEFNYGHVDTELAVSRVAKFIFLNKTCFNGLYRQNSKGQFNVPFGRYKTPKICDSANLVACSKVLSGVEILCGDFELSEAFINKHCLIYLDPPYKPITKTASFTKYHRGDFNDCDQVRLANYYKRIDQLGARIMLSNSDPSSEDSGNKFFDDLYSAFDILRVNVTRTVSAAAASRKSVKELIIKNAGFAT